MTLTDYLVGVTYLTLTVGGAVATAVVARRRLLHGWAGAPARLAEAVLAISVIVIAGCALGTLGALAIVPLTLTLAAVGAAAFYFDSRTPPAAPAAAPPTVAAPPRWMAVTALAVAFITVFHWAGGVHESLAFGIYRQDSTWYHLPFSAEMFQSGNTWNLWFTDPMALTVWFYPLNSELLHALGMAALGNDFLSPFLNVIWMVLCLLAAWCAGRPFERAPEALTAVAVVLDAELMQAQAGNAPNDTLGLFFLLAAAALLLNGGAAARGEGRQDLGPGVLLTASLAGGLAIGTKITLLVPILMLTLGCVLLAPSYSRLRLSALAAAGLVATGGYWYLRNLAHAGNPLPWISPGPLPGPDQLGLYPRSPHSVADYALHPAIWIDQFVPMLDSAVGPLWPLVLGGAAAGLLLALVRGDGLQRALAAAGIAAAVAYAFIPVSASGSPAHPQGFETNLRYLAPTLAIGLVLLSLQLRRERYPRPLFLLAATTVFCVDAVSSSGWSLRQLLLGAVLGFALLALPLLLARLHRGGLTPIRIAAGAGAGLLLLVAIGFPAQRHYLRSRYLPALAPSGDNPGFRDSPQWHALQRWGRQVHDARIGVAGPPAAFGQYVFYGNDLSNRVEYLGEAGPHGSYRPIESCPAWRRALNSRHLGFLVIAPTPGLAPGSIPQESLWTSGDSDAKAILHASPASVFRLTGPLDPAACASSRLPPVIRVPGGGFTVPGVAPGQ